MSRPAYFADHDLNEHIVSGVLRREPLISFLRARDVGIAPIIDSLILVWAATEAEEWQDQVVFLPIK